ncbi:MAG: 3-isopropylmalate dehydrogenase [Crocinitomicaceae bacterium]|nr:3-isopropylmalate dehydrogenase [Crocinitomicaceae bacterium]
MKKEIAVISGDGIGPEVVQQAIKTLDAIAYRFNHTFQYNPVEMGACAIDKYGEAITNEDLEKCAKSDAILLGAIGDPRFDNDPTLNVRPEQGLLKLRKHLGLYSNIRPIATYDIISDQSPLKNERLNDVDFVIYRELIGGIYFGEKKLNKDETEASDLCSYSVKQIERIAHEAFKAAQQRKKKLTLVDKANVLETSRLWRKTVTSISKGYPDVELDFLFVDNAAMQIIQQPSSFDVVLTENMFGDIISDLASVITGSIGLLPSASTGKSNGMFEPIHGSYPQAKGQDIANPNATILSVAMMMDYFEFFEEAKAIREAVEWTLSEGIVSKDISKAASSGCNVIGDHIANYIENYGEVKINKRNTEESKGVFI